MKRRLPVLTGLLVLLLIVQSGCVAATEAPLQEPLQQPSAEPTVTLTTSDGPPAVQVTLTETVPEVTLPVEATATPFEERPPTLVTPPDKPSLAFPSAQDIATASSAQGIAAAAVADVSYGHVIGFVFPDGQVALRLAAVNSPRLIDADLTVVGAVEIGSVFYHVAIDLESTERQVRGRLIGRQDLTFERTPLIRNPTRPDSPTFPAISPIISSNGICFVVGQAEALGKQAQPTIAWSRYCSFTETGSNEPLLSVRDTYPQQFIALRERMDETRSRLEDADFPQDVEAEIDTELTIGELEGHPNIISCSGSNECVADIIGAPSARFWDDYDRAMEEAGGERFAVTVGIVRVERNLEVPDQELVRPGVYWVRVWFEDGETFMGSTLLGVTDEGQTVLGQTIPSTPAYFLDADDPRSTVSWISAWRLRRWCMWQSNCP